jgi:hypothetical protein
MHNMFKKTPTHSHPPSPIFPSKFLWKRDWRRGMGGRVKVGLFFNPTHLSNENEFFINFG